MSKRALISLMSFFVSISAYSASVDFMIEDRGQKITQQMEVVGSRVFLRNAGGDPNQDILFDAGTDVLYVIQHSDKSYLHIDDRVIDEVAALVDSVSGAVEGQQNVLSDLLSTFGIDSAPREKLAPMKRTERSLTIGGYPCVLFQAHLDGEMQSEMCIAGNSALKLSGEDFQTLSKFFVFGTRLMNRAGKLLSALGMTLPPMELAKTDGLPIGLHSPGQQLKVKLNSVNPVKINGAGHQIPEGYTRSAIPFTSG